MRTILIFCAHSDDEAVGMAGTIAKFVDEKYQVIKVVLSFGESSHPHFQEDVVIKKRVQETEEASKFIGIKKTMFLGLKDFNVKQELKEKNGKEIIKKIIEKYKPLQIYVPTDSDPHPDHKAVNKVVLEAVDVLRKNYPIYAFEVWNLVQEGHPLVYIDITKYYKKKIKYIKTFASQWVYMYSLMIPVYIRSRTYGWAHNCKYAERFYKIR
ncbi:MAG: PIG-L family deacetylase [archaeon]